MDGSSQVCKKKVAHGVRPSRRNGAGGDDLVVAGSEHRFLHGLVHGMRCGILAVDRDARLMMINDVARQILELEQIPPTGTPVAHALCDHPHVARVLRESFEMVNLPNRAEMVLHPGEPGCKTVGFTLSMVRGTAGQPLGSAMFFKDLTQIEHKEEQERLKDRLAALGEMAASMAHEIRNPLASIEVSCKLLKRRLAADSTGHSAGLPLLDKIVAEVRRLNTTITSSLEFVRPLSLQTGLAELCPLLEEAITVATERARKPGIRIIRRYRGKLAPFLMDRRQLRQVFENLVLNAMEAIGDAGVVTVEVETRKAPSATSIPYPMGEERIRDPWVEFDEFVVIRIRDTGPGIDEAERDRIFYPFFTTKQQGSGVGLSMAKKIISSHRGLIDIDSAAGGGAVFTVRLPMVLEKAEV